MRDIVLATFPANTYGPDARPALVLTRHYVRSRLRNVTIAPITRTIKGMDYELPIDPTYGVSMPSVANLDNITTLRKEHIGSVIGHLPDADEPALHRALVFVYDLRAPRRGDGD